MKRRSIVVIVSVGVALAGPFTMSSVVLGQNSPSRSAGAETKAAKSRAAAPRTPWGDPDLQGTWTSRPELGIPFERSVEFGNRQFMTDQEYEKQKQRLAEERGRDNAEFDPETADVSRAGQVGSPTSPSPHWLERGTASRRTSLVIDPPDGRVPQLTPEGLKRAQSQIRGSFGEGPFDGPADFTLYDRCITRNLPGTMFPAVYNANTRIVQAPGHVAITYEMIHETRIVRLDGSPHISPALRQYHGDSRGRFEGDTLVIDVTNFNDTVNYRGSTSNLHLVERFTRADADTLRYEVTVDDPQTFSRSWIAALNLKPQLAEMYEYACHEGNYGMHNMLSAARAAEKQAGGSHPSHR